VAFLEMEPKTFWGPIGWNDQGKNVKGSSIPSQIQDDKLAAVWPLQCREAEPKKTRCRPGTPDRERESVGVARAPSVVLSLVDLRRKLDG
jgi:hypothetical protein